MTDDTPDQGDPYDDLPDERPDEHIPYLRDIEIYDDAEDVKRVRLIGDDTIVDVGVTDLVMVEFLRTAETVFDEIHAGMAEMRDIMSGRHLEPDEGEGDEEDDA